MDEESVQWAVSLHTPERDRKGGWEEYRTSGRAVEELKEKYRGHYSRANQELH